MTHTRHTPVPFLACLTLLATRTAAQDTPQKSLEERMTDVEKKLSGDFMRAQWKDGLRFETLDKRYKLKLGGRMHYDFAFFDPDSDTKSAVETGATRIEDGSEIRRARIEVSGEVGDAVEWATAVDFGSGTTNFRNMYVGLKERLFGASVRAGQFKEPYGLEQITSSNNILFIERSLMNAFVPSFNAGLMVFDALGSERMTWAIGAFRSASDAGEVSKGDGEWATTARITGLATIDEAGDDYVHLGLGLSRRSPTQDTITFSSKPEANLAPNYVTAAIPAETVDLIGAEAAWVRGPLTLSGEYTMAMVDAPSGATADPDLSGYYLQAAYFITGESRGYRKAQGCFDAIKPRENAFGKESGIGAWELAVRASSIDLVDDGIDGGELEDLTFGVNWYLNPNTRVMGNYILADLDPTGAGADGDTNIIEFRVQFAY